MKQLAGSIRIGWVIEYKGKPWTITKAQHIKPGKGGAFMQVEMKSVEEGTKTNERYRTEDTVEKMMVEDKDCQFLFEDGTGLNFMESETFEQFSMPADILGDSRPFLTEGMVVRISHINDRPISVQLPQQVVCTVNLSSKGRRLRLPTNRRSWTTVCASGCRPLLRQARKSLSEPKKPTM